jgi:hypothetical protein
LKSGPVHRFNSHLSFKYACVVDQCGQRAKLTITGFEESNDVFLNRNIAGDRDSGTASGFNFLHDAPRRVARLPISSRIPRSLVLPPIDRSLHRFPD